MSLFIGRSSLLIASVIAVPTQHVSWRNVDHWKRSSVSLIKPRSVHFQQSQFYSFKTPPTRDDDYNPYDSFEQFDETNTETDAEEELDEEADEYATALAQKEIMDEGYQPAENAKEKEEREKILNNRRFLMALTEPIAPPTILHKSWSPSEVEYRKYHITPESYFGISPGDFAKLVYFNKNYSEYERKGAISVMTRKPVDEDHFHDLLQSQAALSNNIPLILRTLELMKDLGLELNIEIYTTAISGCKSSPETAEKLLEEITAVGIPLDRKCITAVINCYVTDKRVSEAYNIMRLYALGPTKTMEPDCAMFTTIISGCLHAKNTKLAWSTFDLMRQYYTEPDSIAFSLMIAVCAQDFETERAFGLFEEMEQLKMPLLRESYEALLKCCARRHDYFLKGFDVLKQMKVAGFRPDIETYHSLLSACGQVGNLEAADMVIEQMAKEKLSLTIKTYSILLGTIARSAKLTKDTALLPKYIERAEIIFQEIQVFSSEKLKELEIKAAAQGSLTGNPDILDLTPGAEYKINTTSLNNFLLVFANTMNLRKAEAVFARYKDFGLQPDIVSFNIMIKMFAEARRVQQCFEYYQQMRALDIQPDDYTWRSLLNGCAKAQYINNGLKIIRIMVGKNVEITPDHIHRFYRVISSQKLGGLDELKELVWPYPNCRIFFLRPPPINPSVPEPHKTLRPGEVKRRLKGKRWKKKSSNRKNKPKK